MALRDELHRWLDKVPEGDLGSIADFLGYLDNKRERDLDRTSEIWERDGASEMAASLAELERDVPPTQVQAWLGALTKNATAVRFNEATGEIDEVGS